MLSEAFYRKILADKKIEFAICDADRCVVAHSPGLPRFIQNFEGPLRGQALEMLFDELAGGEEDLDRVRRGDLPGLTIAKIFRTFPDGRSGYITLVAAPHPPGLLVTIADVTAEGQLEQRVTHQRNELDLLAGQLAQARAQLDDLLHRFVPSAVADQMIANPKTVQPGGERRIATVLFADLRGFTRWSEKQPPEKVLELLNQQMAAGINAVLTEGGTLDKFMGDALMAVFNAPTDQPDHALRAVRAARAMLQALSASSDLRFSIGINTGLAVAGNVGTERVMNYTVIGDAVNQAKRLQEMAAGGQILVSETTYAEVAGQVSVHHIGQQVLRGRSEPVDIYQVDMA